MAESMDIWNAMNRKVSSPIGPCGIGSNTTVLHLNREIEQETPPLINEFLDEYLVKHDLAHLYALSSACFEVIESVIPLISLSLAQSKDDFGKIINSELDCFQDIQHVLDPMQLAEELWEVASGGHWSQRGLETPDNMSKLGQLSFELQKRIEDSPWDLSEMVHAYMCSLTIGNYKKFDYESFTFQISRGIQCDETISNFIPYLQEEASGREAICVERQYYEAEVLRLIQWAEIGNISEYVRDFCEAIKIHHPQPIDENFHDTVWRYLNTPFPLFRSDLALEYLKDELTKYLFACQVWLENMSQKNKYSDDPLFHVARMTISAIYLFGAYRLDASDFDKDVLERAGSYIQTYQQPDASFIDGREFPWMYLELNAMIVHALWISEAFGWRRTIRRTFDWIIGQLDIYGVWYDLRYRRNGYLTGLLLDTIELVEDGEKLTFSIPKHKRRPTQVVTEESENLCASNTVIEGNIYNIFGNIFQSGSVKRKNPKKKIQVSGTKKKQDKHREWTDCGDACLEFTADNRIKFHYQDESTDLHLRHSGYIYEFLMELKDGECPQTVLNGNEKIWRTRNNTKRKFADVIRRTNELLNKKVAGKVKIKGFADIPNNIKFVGYDKQKKVYRFYIHIDYPDRYPIGS